MKKLGLLLLCISLTLLSCSTKSNGSDKDLVYVQYVDPFIGSGGHGHVFVGASVPFGAVQVGPSNFYKGWDWCSGYNYQDSVIIGFPQLHLSGTGIGDLGDVLIMPYMGDIKLNKGEETVRFSGYSSLYSHSNEIARPGYYYVKLDDFGVEVELSASERVGFHKYSFPEGKDARIIIDLVDGINDKPTDTYLEQIDETTFVGHRFSAGWAKVQKVFFAIKTDTPIKQFSLYEDLSLLNTSKAKGVATKGLMSFEEAPRSIKLKVGISPVSAENALANIDAEIPHWDISKVIKEAEYKWEKELARIQIHTNNEVDKRIFYTAMYHAMIHPTLFNDYNGEYRGNDDKVYKSDADYYTIFSLWDTYRAAHPLYTLIQPEKSADFVNTMLKIFDQTGKLPIWQLMGYDTGTMVGISSFQAISEAYTKGVKGFDAEKAFHALNTVANSDTLGLKYHRNFEPIPSDVRIYRPVARALEYAIGDGCIALMAKKMGKQEEYQYFAKRAQNHKLYYDTETGFFRGKLANGEWNPTFDPIKSIRPWSTDYAEGNAWQYLWLVPQDVSGLISLIGGEEKFINRLDTFFSLETPEDDPDVLIDLTGIIGQYAHGNEPSHHIAYLYNYVGQQWKTAQLIRHILKEFYHDKPDGLIGNEDCGQMSAWYIFSALGFYPVLTASDQYVIGSPLFDKATIKLAGKKEFTVETINNSPENIYIQKIELNGKSYKKTFITHQAIMNGGTLTLTMGKEPNKTFGIEKENRPYSGFDQ